MIKVKINFPNGMIVILSLREKTNTLLFETSTHLAVGGILDVRVHPSIPNSNPLQILSID